MRLQAVRLENTLVIGAGLGFLALLIGSLLVLQIDPTVVLALCVGAVTLVTLIVNPLIGVHVIVALLYCENALVTREGFTAMKAIGPFILAAWIMNVLLRRQNPFRAGALGVAMVAFLLWGSLSLFYARDSGAALLRLATFAQLVTFTFMCVSVLDNVEKLTSVCWAMIWWCAAATVYGFYSYATGRTDMVTGPGENRNAFSMFLAVSIILTFLLSERTSRLWLRSMLRFVLLPFFLLGLALTFSRTGYLCLVAGWLSLSYRMARARRIWPVLAVLAVIVLVSPLLPEAFFNRVESIVPAVSNQSDTFGQRVNIWEQGIQMVKAHPITGIGLGNFHETLVSFARGRDLRLRIAVHSAYVGVAAEGGLVALALYLLMHVLALRSAALSFRTASRLGRIDLQLLSAGVESGILIIMVLAISGNLEVYKILWLLFAMACSLGTIARKLEAAGRAPSGAGAR